MNNGQVKWYLSTRDGATGYKTVFFTASNPVLYRWYTVEMEWILGSSGIGGAVLKIDSREMCRIVSDTTAYGEVTRVRFGLAEICNCNPSTIHVDCCAIQYH